MTTFILFTILSYAVSVSAIGILLPLYVFPSGMNAGAWSPVYKAISSYPKVEWQIVINPNNGPGTTLSSPYPSLEFITAVKNINRYANVETLGYVDTNYGNRPLSDIQTDIDIYSAWDKYSSGDISMDGIFLDVVPSLYDFRNYPKTQSTNETYFRNISSYINDKKLSDISPVVCNPGNPADPAFFDYCDTIAVYENLYSKYDNSTLGSIQSTGSRLNQSAILLHSVPQSLTISDINKLVAGMKAKQVEFIDMTNDFYYRELNETLLMAMAAACNDTPASASNDSASYSSLNRIQWLSYASLLIAILSLF